MESDGPALLIDLYQNWQVLASDLWKKRVATLLAKLIVIPCDFSPLFPLLKSKVHVFLQLFLTYVLNVGTHQRSVMALKANEDARVKKKACNADFE